MASRVRPLVLGGLLSALFAASAAAGGASGAPGPVQSVETRSEIFTMDKVYPSMFGPMGVDRLKLSSTDHPELLWITGIRADMVGADGKAPQSPEYFCHSVFSRTRLPSRERLRRAGLSFRNGKLFTLVQGLNEIRFPEGFGVPVFSDELFSSHVMVMNPTEHETPVQVGVDSHIDYVRDSQLEQPMKPLFMVALVARVPVEGQPSAQGSHAHGAHGMDMGAGAGEDDGSVRSVGRKDPSQHSPIVATDSASEETGHWYVPPGRHVYHDRLGRLEKWIPFDTRIHYIATHLHPYGESVDLVDLTTGKSVYKATATDYTDRVAIRKISHYSSAEGLPIDRHHEYELVVVYDNTTDHDVDSMAVMYLYLHDSLYTGAQRASTEHGS